MQSNVIQLDVYLEEVWKGIPSAWSCPCRESDMKQIGMPSSPLIKSMEISIVPLFLSTNVYWMEIIDAY